MKATIIDYGRSGEGIAKINGKVFFIPKTIIGEEIEFSCTKENSKFCSGKVEKIIKRSQSRQEAPCKYYDKCGGCNFQHISYDDELNIKKSNFLKEFSKFQKLNDIKINKCSQALGYRNKLRFAVNNKNLGFYENKSNNFLPIDNCLLANNQMNFLINKINNFLKTCNIKIKEVIIYQFDEVFAVDFVTNEKATEKFNLIENVLINHKGPAIPYKFNNFQLEFNGDQFRQVNDEIASLLYKKVEKLVENENVINAYSGAGLLSAMISKKAKNVIGIELNESAHKSAEDLKVKNKLFNLTNVCGYAEREIFKYAGKCSCIIIDPPRAGCDKKFIDCILSQDISKIIYISCNPATLVRDLCLLKEKYNLLDCELYDMFPRTANVETLVVLSKKIDM